MTRSPLSRAARIGTYAFQVGLVALGAWGLLTGATRVATNAALAGVVAAIPIAVRLRFGRPLHPVLSLWIAVAAFMHAAGITGIYREFGWYDQVAHGVSSALVAGVGYAFVRTVETEYETVSIPADLRALFVVVFTVGVGVVWEVSEFALGRITGGTGDSLLVQFGLGDVVWDLVFDLVGAVVVALWGTSYFEGLRSLFARYVGDADGDGEHPH